MEPGRQRRSSHAEAFAKADLIAPERRGHVVHFTPVFSNMDIIDAEFEEIASERTGPAAARTAPGERPAGTERFDREKRPAGATRRENPHAAALPASPSRLFPAALAALCAMSFWVFGGHAVLARLAGRDRPGPPTRVISDVQPAPGRVGGLRIAIVDGPVAHEPAVRQMVPAAVVRTAPPNRPDVVRRPGTSPGGDAVIRLRSQLSITRGETSASDVTFIDDSQQAGREARYTQIDR